MTELEKKLAEVQEILKKVNGEIEGLSELTEQQQLNLLQKINRDIGKRQNRYSIHSEEYERLKKQRELVEEAIGMLIQREKERSGLKAAESHIELKKEKYTKEYREELVDAYRDADTDRRKQMYRQIYADIVKEPISVTNLLVEFESIEMKQKGHVKGLLKYAAEKGDPAACRTLMKDYSYGVFGERDDYVARVYLEKAAKSGDKEAMYTMASEYCGMTTEYKLPQKEVEAYKWWKRYIEASLPLDKECRKHKEALYQYYHIGLKLGYDMNEEKNPVSWRWLLECDEHFHDLAKKFEGDLLAEQDRYEEAIQVYLDLKTPHAIREIKKIIYTDYFLEQPEKLKKLEIILERISEAADTDPYTRAELYSWYAWRHETGKRAVKNYALAYIYYLKILRIIPKKGNEDYRRKIEEHLTGITIQWSYDKRMTFFQEVIEEGGFEVCQKLGDMYMKKSMFDKALVVYAQGVANGYHSEVLDGCSEGYKKCKEIVDKRKLHILQCEEAYEQCLSGIGRKEQAFEQLRNMAKNGNTYAALRFAQIAESDLYLKRVMPNFPNDDEIFKCYYKAAEAGEREAIKRILDIYENGGLGMEYNPKGLRMWGDRL